MREALVINRSKRLLCDHPEIALYANPVGHGYLVQVETCPVCHQRLPGRRVTFGLRPGSGDYIGIHRGRFVSVEFKATGKRPRKDQRQWMELIRQHNGQGVWLYSHWGGWSLPTVLQRALRFGVRWDDPEYLARIVFDSMTAGSTDKECGYGIGLGEHGDIEHDLLVVEDQQVAVYHKGSCGEGEPRRAFTIAQFLNLDVEGKDAGDLVDA
jgi:hypothetical protein